MAVIHNISKGKVTIGAGLALDPDEIMYLFVGDNYDLTCRIRDLKSSQKLRSYPMDAHRVTWTPWQTVEHAVFAYETGILPPANTKHAECGADAVVLYLDEKLPHTEVALAWGQGALSLCCLSRVSPELWERVILPGLRQLSKEHRFRVCVAKRWIYNVHRLDFKLYFFWDSEYTGLYKTDWKPPQDYQMILKFFNALALCGRPV